MPDRSSDNHAFPGATAPTIERVRVGQATVPVQPSGRR